ncbi:MAG: hypothetical protein AAGD96_10520, partial [Chloroflexota bacterium]
MRTLTFRILTLIGTVVIGALLISPLLVVAQEPDQQPPRERIPLNGPTITFLVNGVMTDTSPVRVQEGIVNITIQFSEEVSLFTIEDLNEIENGQIIGALEQSPDDPKEYTFQL